MISFGNWCWKVKVKVQGPTPNWLPMPGKVIWVPPMIQICLLYHDLDPISQGNSPKMLKIAYKCVWEAPQVVTVQFNFRILKGQAMKPPTSVTYQKYKLNMYWHRTSFYFVWTNPLTTDEYIKHEWNQLWDLQKHP